MILTAGCYIFAVHLGALNNCVPGQYSIAWIYVLPRGYASILDLGTLVTYGLYDLDVSVSFMLCVLHAVLHMLCVAVFHLVEIGVHDTPCLQLKYAFGLPCFALLRHTGCWDAFQLSMQPWLCPVLMPLHRCGCGQYAVYLHPVHSCLCEPSGNCL